MRALVANWLWLLMFSALAVGFIVGGWSASSKAPSKQQTERANTTNNRSDDKPSTISQPHSEQEAAKAETNEKYTSWSWVGNFFELKLTDVIIAIFTVVLAVKTSGLFVETAGLRSAAEKQSKDMEASIKAATDAVQNGISANQIAVTNAERQLRAYVTARGGNLDLRRLPSMMGAYGVIEGAVHEYSMAPIFFNGGQTPAINVVVNASTQHFEGVLPTNFDFPDSENFGHGVIGPQSELFGPAAQILAREIDPEVGGFWYMWGWVEYDDIFEGTFRHRTEFCFEINRETLPSGQLWLGFRPIDRFNGIDQGCLRPFNPHENKYG